ncbi:MAG: cation transporting ATPase C-terminal domain-containing protein [Anaerolineae bacterium]|nr:cation transporting ATPase C-terminal domain-containing protein [Anaerolineae bacterium]
MFSIELLSNRPLVIVISVALALQMSLVYLPFAQKLFGTTALPLPELLASPAISTLIFWVVEGEKWLIRPESIHNTLGKIREWLMSQSSPKGMKIAAAYK